MHVCLSAPTLVLYQSSTHLLSVLPHGYTAQADAALPKKPAAAGQLRTRNMQAPAMYIQWGWIVVCWIRDVFCTQLLLVLERKTHLKLPFLTPF